MNTLLILIGAGLMALGVAIQGNRSGFWLFVIGPRSILFLAALIASVVIWTRTEISNRAEPPALSHGLDR